MGFARLPRAGFIQIDDTGKVGIRGLMNHSKMVAAKRACADNGDTGFTH